VNEGADPGREPLVVAEKLTVRFPVRRGLLDRTVGHVHAVEEVNLAIAAGEVVGVVGESGSGKSTLGRAILRLLEPSGGRVRFAGQDITHLPRGQLRPFRRQAQMIFQDPFSSLNPRMRVKEAVGEAVRLHGIATGPAVQERVTAALRGVGLAPEHLERYPRAFSGGQRQRLAIARALVRRPAIYLFDDSFSALDLATDARLRAALRPHTTESTVVIVAQRVSTIRDADQIIVLEDGRIVGRGRHEELLDSSPTYREIVESQLTEEDAA
jgi:ABC-type microcin C transport system duplicated ATPase subunit YejF